MILSDKEIIGIKDYAELIRKLEILAVDMHWPLMAEAAEAIRELVRQRDELLAAAEAIEIDSEECLDFDECTAMLVPIDTYHKLTEAIASVKGQA